MQKKTDSRTKYIYLYDFMVYINKYIIYNK